MEAQLHATCIASVPLKFYNPVPHRGRADSACLREDNIVTFELKSSLLQAPSGFF